MKKIYMREAIKDVTDFMQENDVHEISNVFDANDCIEGIISLATKLRILETEFLAMGLSSTDCEESSKYLEESRKYVRELKVQRRELDRSERHYLADLKEQRQISKVETRVRKIEGSTAVSLEGIRQYPIGTSHYSEYSLSEIEQVITDIQVNIKEFRFGHSELAAILGDRYGEKRLELEKDVTYEAEIMILSLKNLIRERRATQVKAAEIERVKQAESDKIWGNQLANEIKLRCDSLTRRIGVDPVSLPDSQILEFNAGLYHLENDASRILEKLTEYSRHVVVLGEIEQLKMLNELLNHTLRGKDDFIMAVRREIEVRDLSKEKIKNALGLKIKFPSSVETNRLWTYILSGINLKNSLCPMSRNLS